MIKRGRFPARFFLKKKSVHVASTHWDLIDWLIHLIEDFDQITMPMSSYQQQVYLVIQSMIRWQTVMRHEFELNDKVKSISTDNQQRERNREGEQERDDRHRKKKLSLTCRTAKCLTFTFFSLGLVYAFYNKYHVDSSSPNEKIIHFHFFHIIFGRRIYR